jgi:hypothetical protein
MRRIITAAAVAAAFTVFVPASASAAKPSNGCPVARSGFDRVDRDGWMNQTLIGFAEEGIETPEQLDAAANSFGFENWDALAAYIVGEQWDSIDLNGNDFVCMKNNPNTPGNPGYLFIGLDDRSSSTG